MKYARQCVTIASIVLMCGAAASAQSSTGQPANQPDRDRPTMKDESRSPTYNGARSDHEMLRMDRNIHLIPGDWILGEKIVGTDGKRLGSVRDLILDASDGHIVYAVINRAPSEDASPSIVAVPWLALEWNSIERVFTLPMGKARLAEARAFDTKRWDLLNDQSWIDETNSYFHTDADTYHDGWDDADWNGNRHEDDENTPDGIDNDDQHRDARTHTPGVKPDGSRDSASMADTNEPTRYVLAKKIEGQTLRGAEDKEIGDVADFVFDSDSGRLAFIVAEFGGFLGIGDSKVAVPWSYFKVNESGHLYTNEVKSEIVRSAPRIERDDWAELRDVEFAPRVYRHFGMDGAWLGHGFNRAGDSGHASYDEDSSLYSDGSPTEVTGKVNRVTKSDSTSNGPATATLVVTTDAGDRLVRLAPSTYLDDKGCSIHEGDRVTIKGNTAMVDGKQVLIASSIKGPDNKTVEFRDSSGRPMWLSQPDSKGDGKRESSR